jgi:hypothetical protein
MKRGANERVRFQFVTGVTTAALEDALNAVPDELDLKQVIYASGAGFVAVLERKSEPRDKAAAPGKRNER